MKFKRRFTLFDTKKQHKKPILYQDLIVKAARKYSLNPQLVAAIVKKESGFNTDAMRYEEHYKWTLEPEKFAEILHITVATERECQKFSYGLMQVMGAVAREHGYAGPLFKLCRPDMGLEYGCKHFAGYMARYNDIHKALAAYNGGPGAIKKDGFKNEQYVNAVISLFSASEKLA